MNRHFGEGGGKGKREEEERREDEEEREMKMFYLAIHFSICISICILICMSVCQSLLSICWRIYLFISVFIYILYIDLNICHELSVYLSLSINPYKEPSIYLLYPSIITIFTRRTEIKRVNISSAKATEQCFFKSPPLLSFGSLWAKKYREDEF